MILLKRKIEKKKLMPIIREEGTNVEVSVLDSVCLQRKNSNNYGRDERKGGRGEKRVKLFGGRKTYHIIFTLICPVTEY